MRAPNKLLLRLLSLGFGIAACVGTALYLADVVENRTETTLRTALDEAGFAWASVEIDGLNARISGTAPDEATRFRVLRAAGTVVNPANIRDALSVTDPIPLPPPDFRLELVRNGARVSVLGLAPGGAAAKAEVLDALLQLDGVREVADLLSTSPDPAPSGWRMAQDAGIQVVASLQNARVELSTDGLSAFGLARDPLQVTALTERLKAQIPEHMALETAFDLPRPHVSPFVTRFRMDDSGARFDACVTTSPQGRFVIETAATRAGATLSDQTCIEALGAPDDQWDRVAAAAIETLTQIGGGVVTISDLVITLTPDETATPARIDAAVQHLEDKLPTRYRLALPAYRGASTEDAPGAEFSATLSPEGLAIVRGATSSQHTGEVVESLVKARFPADRLHVTLEQHQDLPPGWSVRVLAGLDAFSTLETGRLNVSPDMLFLKGTTGDPNLSSALASNLTAMLGPSTPFLLDVRYVEDLDPETKLPSPEDCLDRIMSLNIEYVRLLQ